PTGGMFPPRSIGRRFSGEEFLQELIERHFSRDVVFLQAEVILRNRYITRVAHEIYDFAKAHVERLVAFHDAPALQFLEKTLRRNARRWQELVDIGEANFFVWMQKIRQQKAHPSVARLWVRNEKRIVRIDREVFAGVVESERILGSIFELADHRAGSTVSS